MNIKIKLRPLYTLHAIVLKKTILRFCVLDSFLSFINFFYFIVISIERMELNKTNREHGKRLVTAKKLVIALAVEKTVE